MAFPEIRITAAPVRTVRGSQSRRPQRSCNNYRITDAEEILSVPMSDVPAIVTPHQRLHQYEQRLGRWQRQRLSRIFTAATAKITAAATARHRLRAKRACDGQAVGSYVSKARSRYEPRTRLLRQRDLPVQTTALEFPRDADHREWDPTEKGVSLMPSPSRHRILGYIDEQLIASACDCALPLPMGNTTASAGSTHRLQALMPVQWHLPPHLGHTRPIRCRPLITTFVESVG
jgi:hypothetical protein